MSPNALRPPPASKRRIYEVQSASGEGVRWGQLFCRLGQEECGYEHVRKPFMWAKTAEDIVERLAGYCSAM
jgi:hypothetical protein